MTSTTNADNEPQPLRYELNRAQWAFCNSTAKETFLYGGYGMGKSFALGLLAYSAVLKERTVTAIFAPTIDVLRTATMRQIMVNCWAEKLGLIEGQHFVVNQQPPPHWGVKPFSSVSNHRIITWRNGSYTVLDSLDNYVKHVGAEYDAIFIDEFQNVTPEARRFLLGRLRGRRYQELGLKHQIFYALTPPKDTRSFRYFLDLFRNNKENKECVFIHGTSFLNAHNLPKDYISDYIAAMDERSVRRYIYGELTDDTVERFVYEFDTQRHVFQDVDFDPSKRLLLWFDFNIGIMATLVAQVWGNSVRVIDEFAPSPNIDINGRIATIRNSRYAAHLHSCIVSGDPARGRSAIDSKVDFYIMLMRGLNLTPSQIRVRRSHSGHLYLRQVINTVFSKFDVRINAKCKNLIDDLLFCVSDKDGGLDKSDPLRTHYLDALMYGLEVAFADQLRLRPVPAG